MNKHHPHRHEPDRPAAEQAKPQTVDANPQAADDAKPQAVEKPQAEETLEKLRAELAAAKDRELRAHAELDNYRKRAAREMETIAGGGGWGDGVAPGGHFLPHRKPRRGGAAGRSRGKVYRFQGV